MRERFLRMFGGQYEERSGVKMSEVNSWRCCLIYALIGFAFVGLAGREVLLLSGDELREETFVLMYAVDYHNSVGRGFVNELQMYSTDAKQYVAKDEIISWKEVDRFVEDVNRGDVIRVLAGERTGVREIFRGEKCYLSLEDSTRRVNGKIALRAAEVALFGSLAAVFVLRAAALWLESQMSSEKLCI